MPSLRAAAANWVFRRHVKHLFEDDYSIGNLRGLTERFDRWAPKPPRGTRILDRDLGNFTAASISTTRSIAGRVILHLPGGGFASRTPALHRGFVSRICQQARAEALVPFYRLAPEDPFPAGLEDCVTAYHHLLDTGAEPSNIVLGGDSAGGCLTYATLLALRDRGTPLPAAAFTCSAVTDMRLHRNGSRTTNLERDPMLSMENIERWLDYVGGDEASLSNPLVSPVLGDLHGLPPLLLQAADTEVLLDDSRRMAAAATQAGVECTLEIFPGVAHGWHVLPWLPESKRALRSIGKFVRAHTDS